MLFRSLAQCCHVLREEGYQGDDIDTFALLLDRDDQAPVLAEQFYWAVLEVLLLRAKPGDVEDVREACSVFDLVLASHTAASQPAPISVSSFLLTLGYADDEVDMVMTSLEPETPYHRFEAMTEEDGSPCRKDPTDCTRLVARQTFVPAMASMLSYARQARTAKQAQQRMQRDTAQYEPRHPLLECRQGLHEEQEQARGDGQHLCNKAELGHAVLGEDLQEKSRHADGTCLVQREVRAHGPFRPELRGALLIL